MLSDEAFKRLGLFEKDSLNVGDEDEYGSGIQRTASPGGRGSDDELDISNLGLPQRLVEALEKRGITQLFPIQVRFLWDTFL